MNKRYLLLLIFVCGLGEAQEASVTNGYFYRRRTDQNLQEPRWPSQEMKSNVINTALELSSGSMDGWLKTDLGWIGALNFEKDYRCSEVAFCSKKGDSEDGRTNIWAHNDQDGIALLRATVGVQAETAAVKWKLRAGYDQLNAGVLGNNWGFLFPGTYRGTQLDGAWGNLSWNYAWTDSYRTPWVTEFGYFLDPSGQRIKELQSVGMRYRLPSGWYTEVAAGLATGWQKRHFTKVGWQGKVGDYDLHTNFQHYRYTVFGKDFVGVENTFGEQNVFSLNLSGINGWSLSLEYVGTSVNFWCSVPEFVPRMSAGYGNSQGRLDYWWNAVSDFNKDGERAVNLGLKGPAFHLGGLALNSGVNLISAQHISGFDSTRVRTDRSGYERGYNFDLGFSYAEGLWKPLSASIHYTQLKAGGTGLDPNDPGSMYARYGLYSTEDLKIMVIYRSSLAG